MKRLSALHFLLSLYFLAAVSTFSELATAQVLPNAQLLEPPSPPPGFIPPPLNPNGVQLETRQLGEGVYALLSNTPFADNAGFVVGNDAVLVIDSHFNGIMGQQIIDAVRAVTDLQSATCSIRMLLVITCSVTMCFHRVQKSLPIRGL